MYNTKLVAKDAVPKTWKELIEPEMEGPHRHLRSDPRRLVVLASLRHVEDVRRRTISSKFARNDVFVAGDGTATRDAVADGERDIASGVGIRRLRPSRTTASRST